jgi:hypothetical protein
MEEQRAREAKMRKTAEQFTGSSTTPGATPERVSGGAPAQPAGPEAPQEEEAPELLAEESGIETVTQLESARAVNLLALSRARQQQEAQAQQATVQNNRDQLKQFAKVIKGAGAVTSETVVGAIAVSAYAHVQIANKLTFRNFDMLPDISPTEILFWGAADMACCFNCLIEGIAFLPLLIGAAAVIGLIAGLAAIFK